MLNQSKNENTDQTPHQPQDLTAEREMISTRENVAHRSIETTHANPECPKTGKKQSTLLESLEPTFASIVPQTTTDEWKFTIHLKEVLEAKDLAASTTPTGT